MADLNTKINTAAMLMAAIGQATEDGVLDEMIGWSSDPGFINEFDGGGVVITATETYWVNSYDAVLKAIAAGVKGTSIIGG